MTKQTQTGQLIALAMPLILLITQLSEAQPQLEIQALRTMILAEIAQFEKNARQLLTERQLLAARYCLCAALDEVILLTEWGSHSEWLQQSLLSQLHQETWGGERVFIILETLAKQPKDNYLVLELLYCLLMLGFEGKYFSEPKAQLTQVKINLYKLLEQHKPKLTQELLAEPGPVQQGSESLIQHPTKKIAYLSAACLGSMLLFTNLINYWQMSDIPQLLAQNQNYKSRSFQYLDPNNNATNIVLE